MAEVDGAGSDPGWTRIDEFLKRDELARVQSICDRLLQLPAAERAARDKPVAGTRHLFELDRRSEFIDDLVGRPRLVDVVTAMLGTTFHRDEVSYRCPQPSHGGQRLHADDPPRTDVGPSTVVTAIVALTAFTEQNGATRLIPGSHLRPDLQRHSGSLESHPDEITLTGDAGTAFVFSGHVLHSGTTNESTSERPALQLVWRR